jgi:hypothetical protein
MTDRVQKQGGSTHRSERAGSDTASVGRGSGTGLGRRGLGAETSLTGLVVAAFPATGKTTFAKQDRNAVVDSDSSAFSWKWLGFDERVRHPDWPSNYIEHIGTHLGLGHLVLVSTHSEVRAALVEARIPFVLVYPQKGIQWDYRERMTQRGSPPALVEKVCDELWDSALGECAAQTGCVHVELRLGQFLSDVIR